MLAWQVLLPMELLYQAFFVMGFFEIGSHKLFAWAGFEPRFSCSLPLELLGLQV
jgi:hypothetical protein